MNGLRKKNTNQNSKDSNPGYPEHEAQVRATFDSNT